MAAEACIGHDRSMPLPADLDQLDADALRRLLIEQERELVWRQTKIERLTHELALHKRHRFGVKAERLSSEQVQLFEETAEADLAAMSEELEQLQPSAGTSTPKGQARRKPLPPELPRTEIHHEPDSTTCACGCPMRRIGEDVAEKLDYTPGRFTVERHIRGKWACAACETLVQAPVPAHIIDKGIPTAGLLAQVLVAKYQDHLPLYRQEGIFGRAGLAIPQSTLAQWVARAACICSRWSMRSRPTCWRTPCCTRTRPRWRCSIRVRGKTHRAYLWSYSVGAFDPDQGGGLRLRRQPRGPSCPGVSGRVARHADLR